MWIWIINVVVGAPANIKEASHRRAFIRPNLVCPDIQVQVSVPENQISKISRQYYSRNPYEVLQLQAVLYHE